MRDDAMILGHHAVAPSELWSAWRPDPLVVAALLVAAVLYRQGLVNLRARRPRLAVRPSGSEASSPHTAGRLGAGASSPAGRPQAASPGARVSSASSPRRSAAAVPVSPGQVVAFGGGLVAAGVALASPLEGVAGSLFAGHMVQHLLLVMVVAPLLVAGRPTVVMAAALPLGGRRRLHRLARRPAVRRLAETASHPVVVWAVGTAVLWAWHLPSLYDAAVRNDAVHAAEHASLLGTAVLLWAAVLGRGRRPLAVPVAVGLLFATALQSAALGAVLTLAGTPLYAVHEATTDAWGLTPLEDQQLAGALMWVPPGIVYLGVMAGLLVRWLRSLDELPVQDVRTAVPAEPAR